MDACISSVVEKSDFPVMTVTRNRSVPGHLVSPALPPETFLNLLPVHVREALEITTTTEKFSIMEHIGKGGFGSVHKVTPLSRHLPLMVAKYMKKLSVRNETRVYTDLELFGEMEDFSKWHALNPGINLPFMFASSDSTANTSITIDGAREFPDVCLLHLNGVSLDQLYPEDYGKLDLALLGVQMLDALHYLHQRRYVYRDIKPENICCSRFVDGEPQQFVLIDLGLCSHFFFDHFDMLTAEENYEDRIFRPFTKRISGTWEFQSVDQHVGFSTARGDFESLGYVLIYLRMGSNGLPWMRWSELNEEAARLKVRTRFDDNGVDALFVNSSDQFSVILHNYMRHAVHASKGIYRDDELADYERYYTVATEFMQQFCSLNIGDRLPLYLPDGTLNTSMFGDPILACNYSTPVTWPLAKPAAQPPTKAIFWECVSHNPDVCTEISNWLRDAAGDIPLANLSDDTPADCFILLVFDGTVLDTTTERIAFYVEQSYRSKRIVQVGLVASKYDDLAKWPRQEHWINEVRTTKHVVNNQEEFERCVKETVIGSYFTSYLAEK